MDIKDKVEEVIKSLMNNKDLKAKFDKDPVKAIEDVLGVDLPDEIVKKVIDSVKNKIDADSIGDIAGKLGGLFGDKK